MGSFLVCGIDVGHEERKLSEKKYDWLTTMRLALSTGTSGNSDIGYYAWQSLVKGGMDYMGETGIYPAKW